MGMRNRSRPPAELRPSAGAPGNSQKDYKGRHMANDGKGPSDWFTEQLSDLKQDLGPRLRELRLNRGAAL